MDPSIGRIVLAHIGNAHPPHRTDGYPAIVTGVNADGTLELNVQCDEAFYRGRQQTNVCLSSVRKGTHEGEGQRWWWPPRVGPALDTSDQVQGGAEPENRDGAQEESRTETCGSGDPAL